MKCLNCGANTKTIKIELYHYTECGLNNVYLKNLPVMKCPDCDEVEVCLQNVEELHALIAKNIARQASRLKPQEIRFLRVHLGFSGVDFAKAVSVEAETVSRWENGRSEMKLSNERLLRILILSSAGPFRDYKELSDFGTSAKKKRADLKFSIENDHWQKSVAA